MGTIFVAQLVVCESNELRKSQWVEANLPRFWNTKFNSRCFQSICQLHIRDHILRRPNKGDDRFEIGVAIVDKKLLFWQHSDIGCPQRNDDHGFCPEFNGDAAWSTCFEPYCVCRQKDFGADLECDSTSQALQKWIIYKFDEEERLLQGSPQWLYFWPRRNFRGGEYNNRQFSFHEGINSSNIKWTC